MTRWAIHETIDIEVDMNAIQKQLMIALEIDRLTAIFIESNPGLSANDMDANTKALIRVLAKETVEEKS